MVFDHQNSFTDIYHHHQKGCDLNAFMAPSFLRQGFFVFLLASLFLGGIELAFSEQSFLTFSSGSRENSILDNVEFDEALNAEAKTKQQIAEPIPAIPPEMHPPDPLIRFYEALLQLQEQPDATTVRIAYFGDSMIEGDLITQTLRNDFQKKFGGGGVGFVPTTSLLWGYRKTIKHRFNEDQWFSYSVLDRIPSGYDYGISGELFLTRGWKPWIKFESTEEYEGTQQLHQARLFYGPPTKEFSYCLVETETGKDTVWLTGNNLVNVATLSDSCGSELNLRVISGDKLPVYGVSMASATGITIDNFGMRNSTGSNLKKISEESLEQFQQHLGYDLVILQFGLNLVSADRTNYSKYEKALRQVVAKFKVTMPDADILIVSVGDKCSRLNGSWQTDPSIPLIIETQERVANDTGVGFLNLFEEMGGRNAMVQWVNSRPALARGDYAHPNRKGAEKVSSIIRDYLLSGLAEYIGEPLGDGLASAE